MAQRIDQLYGELRKKYTQLVGKYNLLVVSTTKNSNTFKRLLSSYYQLKKTYIILRKYSTKKVTELIDHINSEKYRMAFDEYRQLLKIPNDFLHAIEMTEDEFANSVYIDILFEKFLPQPDRSSSVSPIPGFSFPIMLKNYETDGDVIYPFVHFSITGKIAWHKEEKKFLYFLNIVNISSAVELDYFQKTDSLIHSLSVSNFNLLNAKKTIEMHKRMLISLTCSLVGEYSRETSEHLKNMECLTTYLSLECKRLGLINSGSYDLEEYIKDINYTSVLHDIGKMAIPSEILEKPDALTTEEMALVKLHPSIGSSYIKRIIEMFKEDPLYTSYCSFLQIPLEICMYHHERWDGKGYPEGLAGDKIPIAARIISVVDSYEALRGVRSYNARPKSHAQAYEILKKGAGHQFDPAIINAFINIHYKFDHVLSATEEKIQ